MSLCNCCLVSQLLIVEIGKCIYLRSRCFKTQFDNSLSVLTCTVQVHVSNQWEPAGGAKLLGNSLSLQWLLGFQWRFLSNKLVPGRDKNYHWGWVSDRFRLTHRLRRSGRNGSCIHVTRVEKPQLWTGSAQEVKKLLLWILLFSKWRWIHKTDLVCV